ncbi:glycosyltransferase family 2 protein [Limnohabitans sp. Hippo3]|uniref:glycosyltransferase family 2 protein n=1 Tax=Limnohabitans sp. Hippo3 TaxID=1597956 RepID=UPI001E3E3E73|nr:glycosyltransferase family 2 protein [Limnohabitans sp. Hippo3]
MIKVSILIVTYNQKDLLVECLESCLSQTYDNFEIVVADDGSTDGSHEMLIKYSNLYPGKFKFSLSKVNCGISKNSNAGLSLCSGNYVAIMGGDDLMHPDKIKKQVEFMEANPSCDVCYHDMDVFESSTNRSLYLYSDKNKSCSGDVRTVIRRGAINCASATMYRANKIPLSGFREDLPVGSDWMLTVDVLSKGGRLVYIPEVLGRYRRHSSNVSGQDSPIRVQGTKDLIRTCSLCLEEYPQYSKEAVLRLSMVLRESRHVNNKTFYLPRMLASFMSGGDLKSLVGILAFQLSRGRWTL